MANSVCSRKRSHDMEQPLIQQLLDCHDLRLPILSLLEPQDLLALSASSRYFHAVVREHYVERCHDQWPDQLIAATEGRLGHLPPHAVCRSIVSVHAKEAKPTRPLPPPPVQPSQLALSVKFSVKHKTLFSLEGVPLVDHAFTSAGEPIAPCVSWPHDVNFGQDKKAMKLTLVVKGLDGLQVPALRASSSSVLMEKSGVLVRKFVGDPLPFIRSFRVVVEAEIHTRLCRVNDAVVEKLELVQAVLVNTDCDNKVTMGQADVLRMLAAGLTSPRHQRSLTRMRRTSMSDLVFVVEVGSKDTSWCSHMGAVAASGIAVQPDGHGPAPVVNGRTPVDINAQVYLQVYMLSKTTGASRLILKSRVGGYDLEYTSPTKVDVVFRATSDIPLDADKYDVERANQLCRTCSLIHKHYASASVRCEVKGHPVSRKYHIEPTDFSVTLEARSVNCAHPVVNRGDFEEIMSGVLSMQ